MKITRLYSGPDGESHFEDIDIPFSIDTGNDRRSERIKATSIIFRATSGGYDYAFHNPSHRQYVINLEGSMEITVGDGTKRVFGPGDIMLAEDIKGRGHISRAINNQPRKSIFVTLD